MVAGRLLLTGGSVLGHGADVTAVLVDGGRVRAVGADAGLRSAASPGTPEVALAGRVVAPGVVDSHCHVEDAAMDDHAVRLAPATTVDEALQLVATFAAAQPDGAWVRGQTWNPVLQLAERRPPTRKELDEAAGGRPVVLREGHGATASTAALRAAGLPVDGADGHVVAPALDVLTSAVPPWTRDERRAQLLAAMARLNAHGITSAVSGAVRPGDVALLRELAAEGRSTLRVAAMVVPTGELLPTLPLDDWAATLAAGPGDGDAWVRVRGVKMLVDGGMTLGTAWTREPYQDRPDHRGVLVADPERLRALVATAHAAGWPVGLHVVGDAGVDVALDVLTATPPADQPDVLIHASLITPDQVARAAEAGVVVAAQTPFLWRNRDAIVGHLGEDRLRRAVPFRDLVDGLGLDAVAAGTDHPINDLDPFANLYAMTTRRDASGRDLGADQAVTREEAWALLTTSGAAHTGESGLKGEVAVGALADLAVLDRDPLTCSPDELLQTSVDLTVVGGDVVHDARRPAE